MGLDGGNEDAANCIVFSLCSVVFGWVFWSCLRMCWVFLTFCEEHLPFLGSWKYPCLFAVQSPCLAFKQASKHNTIATAVCVNENKHRDYEVLFH